LEGDVTGRIGAFAILSAKPHQCEQPASRWASIQIVARAIDDIGYRSRERADKTLTVR
jgi:hypothetical protein